MEDQAEILLELSLGLLGAGGETDGDREIIGLDNTVLLDLDFNFEPGGRCENYEPTFLILTSDMSYLA